MVAVKVRLCFCVAFVAAQQCCRSPHILWRAALTKIQYFTETLVWSQSVPPI